jgi:hypothetical protein
MPSLIIIVGIAIVAPGFALAQRDYAAEQCARYAEWDRRADDSQRRWTILDRASEVRPQRRDSPLRYLNVSDDEVREIQAAASEIVGNVLVTIAGVVTGCPCEDGGLCTDQVWVLAHRPNDTVGLLLSKVSGHWQIGTVQRWWLRYEQFEARRQEPTSNDARETVQESWNKLMDEFPTCGVAEKLKKLEEKQEEVKRKYPTPGCETK